MNQNRHGDYAKAWIIGAGKFGRRAVAALQKHGASEITVVDRHLPPGLPDSVETFENDGLHWLSNRLTANGVEEDTLIIPALPLHLAAEWLALHLQEYGLPLSRPPLAETFLENLPNALRLSASSAALSHATFLCPPNCCEPQKTCTATGRPRPRPLYRLLKEETVEHYRPLIIRSRQIAAGVGGFRAAELWRIYRLALSFTGSPLLIGTACKCHGIIDSLTID
ncbi:MAG TPA: hypothetical protein VJ969_04340 [Desulfopila sp.]|nr:hypothetical protein [Desulfopila sp.]